MHLFVATKVTLTSPFCFCSLLHIITSALIQWILIFTIISWAGHFCEHNWECGHKIIPYLCLMSFAVEFFASVKMEEYKTFSLISVECSKEVRSTKSPRVQVFIECCCTMESSLSEAINNSGPGTSWQLHALSQDLLHKPRVQEAGKKRALNLPWHPIML